MSTNYPFEAINDSGILTITAELEGPELFPKYYDFFQKHDYEGNGYCWEDHITQILERIAPDLLEHIEFDVEAGLFCAYAETKAHQQRFIDLLNPIFSDLDILAEHVTMADRDRIDD
jgi:hypothetical protein